MSVDRRAPGLGPVVPDLPGLRFQVLHTVDAVLRVPLMDTTRARTGLPTPPLAGHVPGGRARELATGIGSAP